MMTYVAGYSDGQHINYCPDCGGVVDSFNCGGFATCSECEKQFAVIYGDDEDD